MPPTTPSKHNESVQIVTYYCHQCRQQISVLSPLGRCSECYSEIIEEEVPVERNRILAHNRQTSSQSLLNKDNSSATPTKHNNVLEKSVKNCFICLEALEVHPKKLSCGHNFHSKCIDPWLKTNNTCPMCRKIVAINRKLTKPKRLLSNLN